MLFVSIMVISSFVYGQQQSDAVLQDNGVKVYKQKGVEEPNPVVKKSEERTAVQKRTVKDWTRDKCEKAINDIEAKISFLRAQNASEDKIENYTKQLIPIRARLEELKSIR